MNTISFEYTCAFSVYSWYQNWHYLICYQQIRDRTKLKVIYQYHAHILLHYKSHHPPFHYNHSATGNPLQWTLSFDLNLIEARNGGTGSSIPRTHPNEFNSDSQLNSTYFSGANWPVRSRSYWWGRKGSYRKLNYSSNPDGFYHTFKLVDINPI